MNARQKQFTLTWFKELGWWDNPFLEKVMTPVERFVAGYEKERQKLNYFIIENYPLGFITGEKGTGKTTLLLWLWNAMKKEGGKKVVFYTEAVHKGMPQYLMEELVGVPEKLGMFSYYGLGIGRGIDFFKRKILKKEPCSDTFYRKFFMGNYKDMNKKEVLDYLKEKLAEKSLLILIDDIELLTDSDFEFIVDLYNHEFKVQVIAAGRKGDVEKSKLNNVKQDHLKVSLHEMSYEDAKRMIKKRIEYVGGKDIEPFNEHQLNAIYASAQKNPSVIIKKCLDQAIKRALNRMIEKEKAWENQKWVPPSLRNKPKEEKVDINDAIKKTSLPVKQKEPTFVESRPQEQSDSDYRIKVIDNTPSDLLEIKMENPQKAGYRIKEAEEKQEQKEQQRKHWDRTAMKSKDKWKKSKK